MIVELSSDDLVASLDHSIGDLWLQAKVQVGFGGTLFEETESFDDWERHTLTLTSDLEVLEGALGLSAPVAISGHLDRSECVSFFPELLRGGK